MKKFTGILIVFLALVGCGENGATTALTTTTSVTESTAPYVASTSPADFAGGVSVNTGFSATFSESMQPATVNGTSFILSSATGTVAASVIYTGKTAILRPDAMLEPNADYTAKILASVENLRGDTMPADYSWTFRTGNLPDITAPVVSPGSPADGSINVPINTSISAAFNEVMDASTVNVASFIVSANGANIAGSVSYAGTTAVFTALNGLEHDTTYTVKVTSDATDLSGNPVSQTVWSFTTNAAPDTTAPSVASTAPLTAEQGVSLSTSISATFNEALDPLTVNTSTFTVSENGVAIPGLVISSGTTATFTPINPLNSKTTYVAKVSGSIRDLAGNAMGEELSWSFTTESWTKQIGTSAGDTAGKIAVDYEGNVYVVGSTGGSLVQTNGGGSDIFVIKYDKNGAIVWEDQIASASSENPTGVAVDRWGNVFIAGTVSGDFDGHTAIGSLDIFLVKYTAAGAKAWSIQTGTTVGDRAAGVAVDSSGYPYITGDTYGAFGGSNAGSTDVFVAKYNPGNGAVVWNTQFGTASPDYTSDIGVDGLGNIYITGNTPSAFPGNSIYGSADFFLAQINSSGGVAWIRQYGSTGYDNCFGMDVDNTGNTYLACMVSNTIDGYTVYGRYDVAILKYDRSGNIAFRAQYGTAYDDAARDIKLGIDGSLYVVGDTYGNLGGDSAGDYDVFLFKLNSNGSMVGKTQIGTAGTDYGSGVAVDGDGFVYIAGTTSGSIDGKTNMGSQDAFIMKFDGNLNSR